MVRVLLGVLMLLTGFAAYALEARVDRNPVGLDESFLLILESEAGVDGEPDLAPLEADFEVLNRSRNSSFQFINGEASSKTEWRIALMPRRSGELTIPALEAGGERSRPLALTVTAARPTPRADTGAELFLEVSAEPADAYVQQEVIYTARLFSRVNLGSGSSLSEPQVAGTDAVVERLGDDRHYQTTRGGQRYAVVERRYAVYPQRSGSLTIEPLLFDGSIVVSTRGGGLMPDIFNRSSRPKRLRSEPVTIAVQPVPAAWGAGQWLPARSVQVQEQWSPDPPRFVVGEPVTRTLALLADGVPAAQLPAFPDAPPAGLKRYPDQPQLRDSKGDRGITAVRQEKVALIPTHPGRVELPAVEIPWWNVQTGRREVARLPARVVEVLPGAAADAPAAAAQAPTEPTAALPREPEPGPWRWLALLFAAGWLGTALAWWRHARRAPAAPRVAASWEPGGVRRAEKALQRACRGDDPAAAQAALLAWAAARWPQSPPTSLGALARRTGGALGDAVRELERSRFASEAEPWRGEGLWQAFQGAGRPQTTAAGASGALPPLHPQAS